MMFLAQAAAVVAPQLASLSARQGALAAHATPRILDHPLTAIAVVLYAVVGVLVHAAPMCLAARVVHDLRARPDLRLHELATRRGAPALAFLTAAALLAIANFVLFPSSNAIGPFALLLQQPASPLLLWGIPALATTVLGYWAGHCLSRRTKIALPLIAAAAALLGTTRTPTPAGEREKPDIILIGVDSLRPDHLATFGYPQPGLTPHIDRLVGQSVVFPNTYTPQARTYVAYMSLLTGQYPVRNGARENLYPPELHHRDRSIAHAYRASGYTTVFSMDESRFANIDEAHGFEQIESPAFGILDFVVGTMLDTAGTNLLHFLPYADRILPHVAGNRAVSYVYRPEVHDARLARAIRDADPERPLFLAAHFCMPHWPFARAVAAGPNPPGPYGDSPSAYRAALSIADRQVGALLHELRQAGRLENAIVVFLSDHGEALGMRKDRWIVTTPESGSYEQGFYGHGMPAFDDAQTRVVLAFQRFENGRPQWPAVQAPQTASLVDIAPTLFSLTSQAFPAHGFDGSTLLNTFGRPLPLAHRLVFVESGMSSAALQKKDIDPAEVASDFAHIYGITDSGRFELLRSELPEKLRQKQRGVFAARRGLVTWTSAVRPGLQCWMAVDFERRRAECADPRQDAGLAAMQALICETYAADADFHHSWCADSALGRPFIAAALPGRAAPAHAAR